MGFLEALWWIIVAVGLYFLETGGDRLLGKMFVWKMQHMKRQAVEKRRNGWA